MAVSLTATLHPRIRPSYSPKKKHGTLPWSSAIKQRTTKQILLSQFFMTRTPGEDKQEEIQQQQKIGKENEKQNHKLWENNKPMPAKKFSSSRDLRPRQTTHLH